MEFVSSPLYALDEDIIDATTAPTTFLETGRYVIVKETTLQLSHRLAIKGITGVGQLVAKIVDLIIEETREYICKYILQGRYVNRDHSPIAFSSHGSSGRESKNN